MSILKDLLAILSSPKEKDYTLTEEDILRAIDELDSPPVEQNKKEDTEKEENIDVTYTKVSIPGSWSLFKYLGKPDFIGLNNIKKDKRIYFTIPCGFESDTLKFWFFSFPIGGKDKEIQEFFTNATFSEV